MSDAWDDLVSTMDRLRSPGGCPWDAEQTHESLVRYLLEESAELAEAIETGDREGLREELGDVLLQVVFHARVAQEDADDPFDVEDVVRDLTTKLVHRHPHVFAGTPLGDLDAQWDALKAREKGRASVLDGIPLALPALARADKVLGRVERGWPHRAEALTSVQEPVAAELLDVVRRAREAGVDAESALRAALRLIEREVRGVEQAPSPAD